MTTSPPPAPATNAELIRWSFERLNEHDVSALKQFWSDETVERFPDRTCRGAEEVAAYFREVFAALPDFHMEIRGLAERGDDVFVQWHLTGTHRGRIAGLEATGKPVAIDGMDHFVIRDGRVVSNFVVYDQMQYARQLGVLPAEDSPGDKVMKAAFNLRTKLSETVRRTG
jgi:steroid delta-isomerase-like uncharacterized protein